jgi:hypothetical protein
MLKQQPKLINVGPGLPDRYYVSEDADSKEKRAKYTFFTLQNVTTASRAKEYLPKFQCLNQD